MEPHIIIGSIAPVAIVFLIGYIVAILDPKEKTQKPKWVGKVQEMKMPKMPVKVSIIVERNK